MTITVTIEEFAAKLSQFVESVQHGNEVIIAKDDKALAKVSAAKIDAAIEKITETKRPQSVSQLQVPPIGTAFTWTPESKAALVPAKATKFEKIGDLAGDPFPIPPDALAPLTEEELKDWGY